MVALLTPARSATASMLTADRPRVSSSSAAASMIALRAFSLRGRPRAGVLPLPEPPDASPRGLAWVVMAWSRSLRTYALAAHRTMPARAGRAAAGPGWCRTPDDRAADGWRWAHPAIPGQR